MNREIPKTEQLQQEVFSINNEKDFNRIALDVFHYQWKENSIYHDFCEALKIRPETISHWKQIPFLPISFFKSHQVVSGSFEPELEFRSSGTTGMSSSAHYVRSASLYEESFLRGFEQQFGAVKNWCILGLLPSYLERGQSSLVYMVDQLIRRSGHPRSGFYLYNHQELIAHLQELEAARQPAMLFGVTYALLDLAENFPFPLRYTHIMETGGMKGRKEEITREVLYSTFRKAFGVEEVYAEYGMTELLSQAYGLNGIFSTPSWMRVVLRDETDPLSILPAEHRSTGAINVIDLANLHSCSFIATEDIGRLQPGGFEVLGRLDHAEIRGCSLMVI